MTDIIEKWLNQEFTLADLQEKRSQINTESRKKEKYLMKNIKK